MLYEIGTDCWRLYLGAPDVAWVEVLDSFNSERSLTDILDDIFGTSLAGALWVELGFVPYFGLGVWWSGILLPCSFVFSGVDD